MFIVEKTSYVSIRKGLISNISCHKIPDAVPDNGKWFSRNQRFLFRLESSEFYICQPHVDVLDILRRLKCCGMSVYGKLT